MNIKDKKTAQEELIEDNNLNTKDGLNVDDSDTIDFMDNSVDKNIPSDDSNNDIDLSDDFDLNDDFDLSDDFDDHTTDKQNNQDLKVHKKKLSFGNIIRYLIMTLAAIVFLYSGFMLLKIYLEYKQGDDIYKSIADTVLVPIEPATSDQEVQEDTQLPFKYDHQGLLNINPEGVGYLYIPSVSVRLPLVQGTDNDYYLTHTFNRTYNGAGALFEDFRITNGLSASHVIIYGHNMKTGSMFGGLSKYLTPSFYQQEGNDVFYIYTGNKLLEYKIFSVYISEPVSDTYTYNFSSNSALRAYAESMKQLSSYNTGVDVSTATQIVTFSTCTGDGKQRVIVQGTFINESPLE